MPKAPALNLSTQLDSPSRGGGDGGGSSSAPSDPTIDYSLSSAERHRSLPPALMEAKMQADIKVALERAHLDIEKTAVRLTRFTKLHDFVQASTLYYRRGGTQSTLSRIDPDAMLDIDAFMEGKTGAEHNFSLLTEKEQLALLKALLTSQQSTPASFATAVQEIAQSSRFFDMTAHRDYLGNHKKLTKVTHPEVWRGFSKDAQLRSVVSGFSPQSFKDAVIDKLKQCAHTTYWEGLAIIAQEALEEEIRTIRNAAAKKLAKSQAPSNLKETSPMVPKALPDAAGDSDIDDVPSSHISANFAGRSGPCPNCGVAGRKGTALHHPIEKCEFKCCHASCRSKHPHLAFECSMWLTSSLRDKSPPPRREEKHRRDRRDNAYDDDRFDKAQEARLAIANQNARKANLARFDAADYASDSDENANYDADDPEVSAARLYAHSIAVRGNSARIREEPSRATADHDPDVPADSLYWHTVRGNSARTREETSRATAEYEIDRAHRADLAARFGYTPPSSDYDSEADGED